MPLQVVTVPALADNYDFLLHDTASGATAAIDVAEAGPLQAALEARGWRLEEIWLTHHHDDHIAGAEALRAATGARIRGAAADARRLPPLDHAHAPGDRFDFAGHEVQVIEVSGHTVGHVAYHVPDAPAVFTGDSLMALGCGRLFEGSPAQMWDSLSRLAALPPETLVYSGHEYTQANARFAVTIDPGNAMLKSRVEAINAARAKGTPTVPERLAVELETNPFLRANRPEVKTAIGRPDATDAEAFAEIRRRKDGF